MYLLCGLHLFRVVHLPRMLHLLRMILNVRLAACVALDARAATVTRAALARSSNGQAPGIPLAARGAGGPVRRQHNAPAQRRCHVALGDGGAIGALGATANCW